MSKCWAWHARVKLGTQPARIFARADLPTLPPGTKFKYRKHKDGPLEGGIVSRDGWPFLERF